MPVLHRLLTLSNIPYCHETEVLQEIIETSFLSGSVLARCDRKGFYVKVLPLVERSVNSGRKEQWALLCGIKLSPYEYQLIRMRRIQVEHCENKRLLILHHNKFSYNPQTGEAQLNSSPTYQRHVSCTVFGINHRKVTPLFNQKAMRQVNLDVFDGNSSSLKISFNGSENLNENYKDKAWWELTFSKASTTVLDVQLQNTGRSLTVSFGTALDALQAIRFLNMNREILGANLQFEPTTGRIQGRSDEQIRKSTCSEHKGLGPGGSILDVKGVFEEHQYIPVSEMDSRFGCFEEINMCLRQPSILKCYTCSTYYRIVGISPDLSFAAARCGRCDYTTPLTTTPKTCECQPIRWNGELFTRLATTRQMWQKTPDLKPREVANSLVIHHEPLQLEYATRLEYSSITVKMLTQEYQHQMVLLAEQEINCSECWPHKIVLLGSWLGAPIVNEFADLEHAVLEWQQQRIGKHLDEESPKEVNGPEAGHQCHEELSECSEIIRRVYLLTVRIPLSDFPDRQLKGVWDLTTKRLKHVKMEGMFFKDVLGTVVDRKMTNNKGSIQLAIQFVWDKPSDPPLNYGVRRLIPVPDKRHFVNMVECLKRFVDFEDIPSLTDAFLANKQTLLFQENNHISWNPDLKAIVPTPSLVDQVLLSEAKLQPSQQQAVENSLKYMISLIQGPPGAGKTTVSSALIVKILVTNPGKVLVVTPSNAAADAAAASFEAFLKSVPQVKNVLRTVRIYSQRRELSLVTSKNDTQSPLFMTLHDSVRSHKEWKRLLHIIPDPDIDRFKKGTEVRYLVDAFIKAIEKDILRTTDVIFTTLVTSRDQRLSFLSGQFSTILVDETGQALEFDFVPLIELRPGRLVFVGDHQQLRPMVEYEGCKLGGLERSLLERATLLNTELAAASQPTRFKITFLKEQYRMHASICRVVSTLFYKQQLEPATTVLERHVPSYVEELSVGFPDINRSRVQFIYGEMGSKEEADGTSLHNQSEVDSVVKLANFLISRLKVPSTCISIITPYDAQRRRISEKLNQTSELAASISVGNVDAIQGQQNKIVIFSTVRVFNSSRSYDFLADEGRLCVALSRSEELLFVFGDARTFQNAGNQALKGFYNLVIRNGQRQTMLSIFQEFKRSFSSL